jgi:hypothetical protein
MEDSKKRPRSEKLVVQIRDVEIFKFLDRVGYANLNQVSRFITGADDEKTQAAILRRLYLLRRFGYIKTISTHTGNYYALDSKGKLDNTLITTVKLDQLEHHDFLTELFFVVRNEYNVFSEREAIANFKIVGKAGKIPDMVINDWIIEYERTNKSVLDSQSVVNYWTLEQGKNLCVIYANEEIKNRYTALSNSKVKLLAKEQYKDILRVLNGSIGVTEIKAFTPQNVEEAILPVEEQKSGKVYGNYKF